MDFLEFLYVELINICNDFSLFLTNETFDTNFVNFMVYFLLMFSNLVYCLIWCVRFFRIMCFTKITFDGLPMINPYLWPFSFFRIYTQFYFAFWAKLIPPVRYGTSTFDVSVVLGIEALTSITYLMTQLRFFLIIFAGDFLPK